LVLVVLGSIVGCLVAALRHRDPYGRAAADRPRRPGPAGGDVDQLGDRVGAAAGQP
jgi:hypothetical protein